MARGIFFLNSSGIYFNKETLKKFISIVKDSHLTSFCFHFSNGGDIRLGLDDMIIKTSYGEYDLSVAVGKPDENGNRRYINQSEMDELLDYAKSLGVEIIPSLDIPGHMKGILKYFPELCFEGTSDSINIKDPKAVEFAYAFAQKYADYFAEKGCRCFGIGADEFAQDLNNEMGFETIYTNGDMLFRIFPSVPARAKHDPQFQPMHRWLPVQKQTCRSLPSPASPRHNRDPVRFLKRLGECPVHWQKSVSTRETLHHHHKYWSR